MRLGAAADPARHRRGARLQPEAVHLQPGEPEVITVVEVGRRQVPALEGVEKLQVGHFVKPSCPERMNRK
jgi:hypothetical protein